MSKPIHIGSFTTKSGIVYVSDPCYDPPKKGNIMEAQLALKVPKTTWDAYIHTNEGIVTELYVTTKEKIFGHDEQVGGVAVDSGQICIFDSKEFRNDDSIRDSKKYPLAKYIKVNPKQKGEKWYAAACYQTHSGIKNKKELGAGILPGGVVSSSGHGDGFYPVYIQKNDEDEICYIRVAYTEPSSSEEEEDEEEDEEDKKDTKNKKDTPPKKDAKNKKDTPPKKVDKKKDTPPKKETKWLFIYTPIESDGTFFTDIEDSIYNFEYELKEHKKKYVLTREKSDYSNTEYFVFTFPNKTGIQKLIDKYYNKEENNRYFELSIVSDEVDITKILQDIKKKKVSVKSKTSVKNETPVKSKVTVDKIEDVVLVNMADHKGPSFEYLFPVNSKTKLVKDAIKLFEKSDYTFDSDLLKVNEWEKYTVSSYVESGKPIRIVKKHSFILQH